MYVILVGGGNVGFQLTKRLREEGHEVVLMEKDKRRSAWLGAHLGDIVIQGDGCEVRVLREVGASRADVFAAVTGDDEDNLIACQMAKLYFKVKRTIARINDPRHVGLFERLGVDSPVSSTQLIFNIIEQEIDTGEVIPIGALHRGNIEVVETEIGPRSPALNRKVRDLSLPNRALIVCVIRQGQAILVTGDTVIQQHDTVVALVDTDKSSALREAMSPPSEYKR